MNTLNTTVTPITSAGSMATPPVTSPVATPPRTYHRPELRYLGKIGHLTQGVLDEVDYLTLE